MATALNYLDRQSLPVLAAEIRKTIPISDTDYSWLQSAFLLAYGIMYAGGGKLMDWLGARAGYTIMISVWSIATMIHGLVGSVLGLGAARFLLGLGEGGSFPGSAKAVSEWFPAKERSLAFGIFNTGSSVGAVLAPPLIAFIAIRTDWRWVFLLVGMMGFLWAIAWWRSYDIPSRHPRITPQERSYLKECRTSENRPETRPISWIELLRHRQTWGLLLGKFLSDSAWYFYIFWLPKYLSDARHLDIHQIGYYAWVPFAAAGIGSLTGGWFSSWLIGRGRSVDFARKLALGLSAAMMPVIVFVTHVPVEWAILLFSIAFFGQQSWSTLVMIVPTDLFERRVVASVAGLVGFGGAMGGLIMNLVAGRLLDLGFGYQSVFSVVGTLHVIGFCVILLTIRDIRPLSRTELRAG